MTALDIKKKVALLGLCGCKDRCREEDPGLGDKPRPMGVCGVKAEEAGVVIPEPDETQDEDCRSS